MLLSARSSVRHLLRHASENNPSPAYEYAQMSAHVYCIAFCYPSCLLADCTTIFSLLCNCSARFLRFGKCSVSFASPVSLAKDWHTCGIPAKLYWAVPTLERTLYCAEGEEHGAADQ